MTDKLVERLKHERERMAAFDNDRASLSREELDEAIAALSAPLSEEVESVYRFHRSNEHVPAAQHTADLIQRLDRERQHQKESIQYWTDEAAEYHRQLDLVTRQLGESLEALDVGAKKCWNNPRPAKLRDGKMVDLPEHCGMAFNRIRAMSEGEG